MQKSEIKVADDELFWVSGFFLFQHVLKISCEMKC